MCPNGKLMACRDPSAFVRDISRCTTPFKGAAKCPQYVAATKTHGAKCLTLPTFGIDNAPPFGLFACRNATGEMATLCKAAGFPGAGAGAGASDQNDNLGTGIGGTVAKYVGGAGAVATGIVGLSALNLTARRLLPESIARSGKTTMFVTGERMEDPRVLLSNGGATRAIVRQGVVDNIRSGFGFREAPVREANVFEQLNPKNTFMVYGI